MSEANDLSDEAKLLAPPPPKPEQPLEPYDRAVSDSPHVDYTLRFQAGRWMARRSGSGLGSFDPGAVDYASPDEAIRAVEREHRFREVNELLEKVRRLLQRLDGLGIATHLETWGEENTDD